MACASTFMNACGLLAPEKLAASDARVPELTKRSATCGNVELRSMPLTCSPSSQRPECERGRHTRHTRLEGVAVAHVAAPHQYLLAQELNHGVVAQGAGAEGRRVLWAV